MSQLHLKIRSQVSNSNHQHSALDVSIKDLANAIKTQTPKNWSLEEQKEEDERKGKKFRISDDRSLIDLTKTIFSRVDQRAVYLNCVRKDADNGVEEVTSEDYFESYDSYGEYGENREKVNGGFIEWYEVSKLLRSLVHSTASIVLRRENFFFSTEFSFYSFSPSRS